MIRSRDAIVAVLVVAAVLGAASPARAEWFAGLYLGWANTSNTELTFTTRTPRTFEDVEFDFSPDYSFRRGPVDFSITSHHVNFGASFTFGR